DVDKRQGLVDPRCDPLDLPRIEVGAAIAARPGRLAISLRAASLRRGGRRRAQGYGQPSWPGIRTVLYTQLDRPASACGNDPPGPAPRE
ncbi:hypothetical protein CAY88_35700, partial [Pseudomonas aeruginosa]